MPKKKKLDICRECRRSARPAINAAKLGHANCLTTAYRELGVFNERDNFGATPIHFAARNGKLDCLVWLVTRSGVSPNAVSRNGATAAHDAAAMGHLECLQYLLKRTKCSAHDTTTEGATVLHMACRFGRLAIVEWLMEYSGSSPSEKGANDVTPVHLCAAKGHLQCLKLLTSHPQYIPNEQTVHGATAVYFAAQEGCLKCLEWLVDHAHGDPYMMAEDGMAPVHASAQAGQVSCLRWLVEQAGVSIRFKAEDGATPAHFASASGEVECLEWILDHGGSIHDRDNLGGTPVHDAAEQGQAAALSTLIQRGVDVTMEDYEGLRPLDLARDNYHTQCAQLLFTALQPNLLFSLTPHRSLSRASAVTEDDEQALQRAEKQRQFEAAMMAGVSEERKEAMWQSAQQKATTGLQPGLKLLLEGELAASASAFSLGEQDAVLEGSTQLTPAGSLRHSRHSSRRSSKRSSTSEGFKENLQPYKPRPVLSPTLFEQPRDTVDMPPTTKKLKEDGALSKVKVQPAAHLRPIQDLKTQFKPSPIPQRAKFLKKFNIKKKKPAANGGKVAGKEKKKLKKLSKATKEPPVVMVEGDKDGSQMLREKSLESGERENMVAAELLVPESTTGQRPTPVTEQTPTGATAPAEEEKMEEEEKEKGRVNVYDAVAGAVVETAIKESIGKKETAESTSGVNRPTVPPPPVVVPREKGKKKEKQEKKRRSGFEEQAVISHQRGSKSLQNPEETVTVSFVTKTSNVKKSFPVTHHKLLTGDDLSSPESSDEELEAPMRDSFTAPGFEQLDSRAFEEFGLDVKDIEEMREKKERDWQKGMDDLEEGSQSSESTLKADDEEERATITQKTKSFPSPPGWSLDKIDRTDAILNQNPDSLDTADPFDLRGASGAATFVIHEGEEDAGDTIGQFDSAAVYSKMPHDQESSTEVLRMVSQMEERKRDKQRKSPDKIPSGVVRSGSVSEKLKLFGGGTRLVKPPEKHPPSLSSVSELQAHQQKKVHSTEQKSNSEEDEPKLMMESSEIGSQSLEQTDSAHDWRMRAAANKGEPVRDCLRRPVQTIIEETTGEGPGELEDKVTPLPKIHPGLSRRHSEERFRLDGLKPLTEESKPLKGNREKPTSPKGGKYSPPRMRLLEGGGKADRGMPDFEMREKGSLSPGRDKRKSVSVYSPLVVSSMANSSKGNQQGKRERSVSNPSPPQRSSESLALYMNSANLPHLNHLRERHLKEETERAEKRVEFLLGGPRLSGDDVPLEFRGLQLEGGKRRVYVWKQKAGSLHRMTSMQSVNLNLKSVFIFLKVDVHGPLFHHVFLWLGGGVSEFAMHSAYQHCQSLLQCLPGRPQLHREFQGHESFPFVEMMGDQLLSDHERSQQYLNSSLIRASLYRFNAEASSFEDVPSSPLAHHTLTSHTNNTPLILDTPTRVFLWLPSSYWEREEEHQKTALEIAELFISQQSYPRWTPITVATQEGEGEGLAAHFPSWPHTPLQLAPRAKQLKLPTIKAPDVTHPANGQINIWEVSGTDKRPLPQDQFGQFDSSKVYLIQYLHPPHSTLVVYVWVGGEVGEGEEKQMKAALQHAETVGPNTRKPVVIVPAGREPEQLLYLFKGKFVVHRSKGSSQSVRLYKVTGTSALKMKGMEVAPEASSLHSSHTFVLSVEGGREVCLWAGQFSSPAERRGALVISRLIGKTGDSTKLAEGLETPEFWSHLGGKARHHHFTPAEHPVYSRPTFLSCVVQQGLLTFRQRPPTGRSELRSNGCYFLVHKDQILVWQGSEWKEAAVLDVVKSYTTHYHSWKRTTDFVMTMAREGHEGEGYWKWFDLQATPPAAEDEGEEEEMTHIQDKEKGEMEDGTQQDKQGEPDVSHRQPPTSRPLRLTKSQVTAFENVEKLQADLAAHMQSLEEEEEEKEWEEREKEKKDEKDEEEEKAEEREEEKREEGIQTQETKHVSPFRTSQTVRQLSEMIDGLDSMMADLHTQSLTNVDQPPTASSSTKQEKRLSTSSPDLLQDGTMRHTNEDTGQTGLTGSQLAHALGHSALSIAAPSFNDLLTQSEDNLVDSLPAQKRKQKKSAHSSQPYLVVPVEEGGWVWEVRVREKAPVITLMFKVAEAAAVTLTLTSAIFEICETLKIHRPLEDHELVRDVMAAWPAKNKPKLVLRQFATKNILWSPNPPISKHTITDYVKHNHVPDVTSLLLHSQHGSKLNWKEANFSIRGLGIYIISESKHGTQMELSAGLDHHLYTPLPVRGRTIPSPNPFCFVMKPPSSWREKDMKLYCAPNLNSMAQWVHTIRLLKHGAQLKANYTAMKDRLHKRTGQLHDQHS